MVKNETVAAAASTAPTAAVAVERSPQELSGGQQALLGLALVLALSSYQAPPLCLLDEVDAALDETNQVGNLDATAVFLVLRNTGGIETLHVGDVR